MKKISRLTALLLAMLLIFQMTAVATEMSSDGIYVNPTPIPQEELDIDILQMLSNNAESSIASIEVIRGMGVINGYSTHLYRNPKWEMNYLAEIPAGAYVVVYDTTGTSLLGTWYKVNYNGQDGYIHNTHLVLCNCSNAEAPLAEHTDACSDKSYVRSICADHSAEELYAVYQTLPEKHQAFILTYLGWTDRAKLAQLNSLLNEEDKLEANVDGIAMKIMGDFPEGASAVMTKLSEARTEEIGMLLDDSSARSFALDLAVLLNGETYRLGTEMKVTLNGLEDILTNGSMKPMVTVYHLLTDANAIAAAAADDKLVSKNGINYTICAASVNGGSITFTTDGFSEYYFAVDFVSGEMTLSLFGGQSILMSELLEHVNSAKNTNYGIDVISSVSLTGAAAEAGSVYVEGSVGSSEQKVVSAGSFDTEALLNIEFTDGTSADIVVVDGVKVEIIATPERVKPGEEITLGVSTKYIRSASWQWQVSEDGGRTWQNIEGATSDTLTITTTVSDNRVYQVLVTNIVVWSEEEREVSNKRNGAYYTPVTSSESALVVMSDLVSEDEITWDITYVTEIDGSSVTKQITLDQLFTQAIPEINAAGWGHIIFLRPLDIAEPLIFNEAEVVLLADQQNTVIKYVGTNNISALIQVTGGKLILGDTDMAGTLIIDANRDVAAAKAVEKGTNYGSASAVPYSAASCVYIRNGNLEMHEGVTLRKGVSGTTPNSGYTYGGGVTIVGGRFDMYGGVITNCYAQSGGGVCVFESGIFVMHDGEISYNEAYYCGGGLSYEGKASGDQSGNVGYVQIDGGKITHNTANRDGGAIHQNYGTIYMNAGEVSYNTSTCGSAFGIHAKGKFYMNGGDIRNNITKKLTDFSATYGYGGAIKTYDSSMVIMTGGNIQGNTTELTADQWTEEAGNSPGITKLAGNADYGILIKGGSMNVAISGGYCDYVYPAQNAGDQYTVLNVRLNKTYKTLGAAVNDVIPDNVEKTEANLQKYIMSGDTLQLYGSTTETSTITISHDLTIQSMGNVTVTWSAATDQCINVTSDVELNVKAIDGASLIFNAGEKARVMQITGTSAQASVVTLDGDVTLTKGFTTGKGGAVHLNGYATLKLNGGAITNNTATGSGAGVDASGTGNNHFIITSGAISGNKSSGSGAAIRFGSSNSSIEITGGTISDNTATQNGGAIQMDNGGSNQLILKNCIIRNNKAANGGAVGLNVNYGTDAIVTIDNVQMIDNEAAGAGGAIHVQNYSADNGRPFTVTVANSTIADNTASTDGKDIYMGGTLNLGGSVDIGEVYLMTDKIINTQGKLNTVTPVNLTVQNPDAGRVVVNAADAGDVTDFVYAGSNYVVAQNAADNKTFELQSSNAAGKVKNNRTGAEYTTLFAAVEAANAGDTLTVLQSTTETQTVTINKSLTITADGDHTCSFVNLASGSTAGIMISGSGVQVEFTTQDDNSLIFDANLFTRVVSVSESAQLTMNGRVTLRNGSSGGYGGGVLVTNATFNMNGGVIENCFAERGAGVSLNGNGTMNFVGGTIQGNTASAYGGGVDVGSSANENTLTMTGGVIQNNTAAKLGGGIRTGSAQNAIIISGGSILNNVAVERGGGIQVDAGSNGNTFQMTGGRIEGNTSARGGGIDFDVNHKSDVAAAISGGSITGNSAGIGAGIYLSSSWKLDFTGGTVSGNSADEDSDGVGIYADSNAQIDVSGAPVATDPIYLKIGNTLKKNGVFSKGAYLEIKLENAVAGTDVLTKGTVTVMSGDEEFLSVEQYHGTYTAAFNDNEDVVELKYDDTFHVTIDADGKALNALGLGWDPSLLTYVGFDLLNECMSDDNLAELAKLTPSVLSNKTFYTEVTLSGEVSDAIDIVTKETVKAIDPTDVDKANKTFALLASVGVKKADGTDDRGTMADISAGEPFSTADMSQKIPYLYFELYSAGNITKSDSYEIEKIVLTSNDGDTVTILNLRIDLRPPTVQVNFIDNSEFGYNPTVSQTYVYGQNNGNHGVYGGREFVAAGYELLGWAESQDAAAPDYTLDKMITDEWIYEKAGNGTGVGENPPYVNLYAVWKRVLVNLTIEKSGWQEIDETQTFIFTVSGQAADGTYVNHKVAVIGNGSVTIKDLPIGTYTISEDDNWSWRYSADDQTVTLTGEPIDNKVTFENTRIHDKWLDGADYRNNVFD